MIRTTFFKAQLSANFRNFSYYILKKNKFILTHTLPLCLVFLLGVGNVLGQTTITQWGFEGGSPLPGGNSTPSPTSGSGTTSIVGSMTGGGIATGMNTSSGCGAQTSSTNAWAIGTAAPGTSNESSGVRFNASTLGYENIKFQWEQRWSGTATNTVRLQYTTDGSNWTNFTLTSSNTTFCDGSLDNGRFETNTTADRYRRITVDFSGVSGINNNANFGVRILAAHYRATGQFRQVTTTTSVATGGTWRFDNVTISGTIIPSNYNVTYNGNSNTSGTTPTDATNYSSGSTVTVLGNTGSLTRTGYTFGGWNTLANGSGTDRAAGSTFTISANTTLFAKWTANSNTITFDGNGATGGSTASQNINTAASANLTANGFSRTGYTFAGWNTASNGTGVSFADQASYTMGTANITLHAQWTANTLAVTYDSQGGSSISNGSTTTGGTVSNPGNPIRSGYSFNGWFVASSGGSAISFPYTHGQTSNFTLFAQWTVAATPTIDPVTLATSQSSTYGTASSGVNFTVSGSNLNANITATAQSGFEVSTTSVSGYGVSVSISSGSSVYVRLAATQAAGSYNNATAVILSSTGATNVNVTTSSSGNTVSQKSLTITGISISNKTYDATTTATISGTAAYLGLVNGESFSVTGAPSANFNNKNVGTAKPITVSGYTAPSGNYSITQPTGLTADITAKALTIVSPSVTSKTYDGNANATITGTLSGVESGDAVTITGVGTYADANVGNGISVTSNLTLSGTDAGNYILIQPTGLTGNITKANQTITFGALANKTTTDIPFNLTATASSGLTVSYTSSNTSVATIVGNTVTIVGAGSTTITASQIGNANYNAATDVAQTLTVTLPNIEEIIFPQFIQGLNGTNSNRIPSAYYLKINNLNPNTTYRFFCGLVLSTDLSTSSGAGNNIFVNYAGGSFTRATGTNMSIAGQYSTLTTDANGSYTGWFIIEPTGNATRFVPGNNLFFRITLNDGNNGTTAVNYRTSTNTIKVINLVASSGSNNGTGLYGSSLAGSKNFIVLYDNTTGTGRPISASFTEDDGTANTTENSYSSFYNTNVNTIAGAYGAVIPNDNTNGIKRLEFKKTLDNTLIYAVTDNDGNWAGTTNTVNPAGGTTAIALPHNVFDDAIFNENAGISLSQNTTINGSINLNQGTLNLGTNTLTLNGNINRTSGNIDASNASVIFGGSSAQSIPAATFFGNINNLTMNNDNGLTTNQALIVSNNLNLNNGKLDLLGNTLTIGTTSNVGTISGTFNNNSYIVAYDNGSNVIGKVKYFVNSTPSTSYNFPVGDATRYTPFVYTSNSCTLDNSNAYITVHTRASKVSQLNSNITDWINRYWELEPTGITAANYNVTFTYDANDLSSPGIQGNLVPVKYSAPNWYRPNNTLFTTGISQGTASVPGTNTLMWSNLTTFSQFTAAVDQASPLPIELVSFQANCAGDDKINVTWTTASEYNTSHYDVEHSRNGNDWEALTILAAAGNSTSLLDYTYFHENPNSGINYYRLTQYDNDGKLEQFGPVAVDCENMNSTTTLSTYPNPSEGSFYISLYTEEMEGAGVLTITDAKGIVVHNQDVNIQKGNSVFYKNNLNVAPGMYYIQVTNGNESTDIVKHSLR